MLLYLLQQDKAAFLNEACAFYDVSSHASCFFRRARQWYFLKKAGALVEIETSNVHPGHKRST